MFGFCIPTSRIFGHLRGFWGCFGHKRVSALQTTLALLPVLCDENSNLFSLVSQ